MSDTSKIKLVLRILIYLRRLFVFLYKIIHLSLLVWVFLILLVKTSFIQNYLSQKAVHFINTKYEQEIAINDISFDLATGLSTDLFIKDHHQDTLLYSEKISIGLMQSIHTLISGSLFVNKVFCDNTYLNIQTYPGDSTSNLDMFLAKFASNNANGKPLKLVLKQVELSHPRFKLVDKINNIAFSGKRIYLRIDSIQQNLKYFQLRTVLLDDPNVSIYKNTKSENASIATSNNSKHSEDSCKINPSIFIKFINCNNGSFAYYSTGNDFNREYSLTNINFSSTYNFASEDLKQIEFLTFKSNTNSDITVKNLQLNNFRLDNNSMYIGRIKGETTKSQIDASCVLKSRGPLFESILHDDVTGRISITKGITCLSEIMYFVPGVNLPFRDRIHPETPLRINLELKGSKRSCQLSSCTASIGSQLNLVATGQARNIGRSGKELFNLKVSDLKVSSGFLNTLLNNDNNSVALDQLGEIHFKGSFDGFIRNFVAFGSFSTALGTISSDIKMSFDKNVSDASYSGSLKLSRFDLGKLIQNHDIGIVDLNALVSEGRGLRAETVRAKLSATINTFTLKSYSITNSEFTGSLAKNNFSGNLSINDPNIILQLNGDFTKENNETHIKAKSEIEKLNLSVFKLNKAPDQIKGSFSGNIVINQNNKINGIVDMSDLIITDSNKTTTLNNIYISQYYKENIRTLHVNSDIIDLQATGNFEFPQIKNELFYFLERKHPGITSVLSDTLTQKHAAFSIKGNINLKDGEKFKNLTGIPFNISGLDSDFDFDPSLDKLEIKTNRFDIFSGNLILSKIGVNIRSTDQFYVVATITNIINNNKSICGNGKFIATLGGTSGSTQIQLFGADNSTILLNAFSNLEYRKNYFRHQILPRDLYINNKRWTVNPSNYFEKTNQVLQIRFTELTDSVHFLSVRDFDEKGIVFQTDGFNIAFVNEILKSNTVHFEGLFNSTLTIPSLQTLTGTELGLKFVNFKFNKSYLGPLSLQLKNENPELPWKVQLLSKYKDIVLTGDGGLNIPSGSKKYAYQPFDFDVNFDIKNFPFTFLENFVSSISNSTGGGNGKIRFYSDHHALNLEGDLQISEATTFIDYLGVPILIKNQPIQLKKNSILFNTITIQDKLNNDITVSGSINHHNMKNWGADVRVKSKYALVLDTKKNKQSSYYGKGIGAIDVSFTGSFDQMQMNVTAVSSKGTKIYIPMSQTVVSDKSKFIRFKNRSLVLADTIAAEPQSLSGLNLNMQMELNEDAEVSIIFDEITGDILKGRGRGNLQIKSLRNGLFSIYGDYEIEEGQYLFTLYNFVNKPFTLTRGGVANWTGDPLNANINVEAVYEGLLAAPYLLIQEYVGEDPGLTEIAKRRTEVKVKMLLRGSLLKPDIEFDIELPQLTGQLKNYVDNKIRYLKQNQDQLNQQIFGLLVLGTFLNTTTPFEGGLISNLGTTTINTMSEMLSNQFSLFVTNLLSNAFDDVNFISGVDFNIGYDIQNKTLGGANLNESEIVFSLRHRLWNDQWVVTLGGNYKSNSQLVGNSIFYPETVIEWNTPIQGLKLRVYYKGDESIEGLKHKIGTGISIRKEFDNLLDFNKELKKTSKSIKGTNGKI